MLLLSALAGLSLLVGFWPGTCLGAFQDALQKGLRNRVGMLTDATGLAALGGAHSILEAYMGTHPMPSLRIANAITVVLGF